MNRRQFFKEGGSFCLGSFGVLSVVSSCSSVQHHASTTLINGKLEVLKSDFVELRDGKTIVKKYLVLKHESLPFPIALFKNSAEEYTAVLMKCTHNACELNPQGSYLVCPCHGSEFNSKGEVQNPPAEENLAQFKTTFDHEKIYIHL